MSTGINDLSESVDVTDEDDLTDAELDVLNKSIDRQITTAYSAASAYDNAVIIAGYAAFFALWSGVAKDLPPFTRLVTVGLMGPSLMLYVGWQITLMLQRQIAAVRRAAVMKPTMSARQLYDTWQDAEHRDNIAAFRLVRFNPFVLWPSIGLGFAGASVLVWNALAKAFDMPVLTGNW